MKKYPAGQGLTTGCEVSNCQGHVWSDSERGRSVMIYVLVANEAGWLQAGGPARQEGVEWDSQPVLYGQELINSSYADYFLKQY